MREKGLSRGKCENIVNGFCREKLQLGAVGRGLRAVPCSDEAAERLKAEGDGRKG